MYIASTVMTSPPSYVRKGSTAAVLRNLSWCQAAGKSDVQLSPPIMTGVGIQ